MLKEHPIKKIESTTFLSKLKEKFCCSSSKSQKIMPNILTREEIADKFAKVLLPIMICLVAFFIVLCVLIFILANKNFFNPEDLSIILGAILLQSFSLIKNVIKKGIQ